MQLLGHAYLRKNLINEFKHAMAEAKQLAQTFDPKTSSTQGHYSLGTVYEEYECSYTDQGQMQKAIEKEVIDVIYTLPLCHICNQRKCL